jgi:hypothetical protein
MTKLFSTLAVAALSLAMLAPAKAEDRTLIWPKNSQFTCGGTVTLNEGSYQLNPDSGMLTWCDADLAGKEKDQVLKACPLNTRCQIKGIIEGHGAFGWVKIISARSIR